MTYKTRYTFWPLKWINWDHNELEQYVRRNSLRISNFKMDSPPKDEQELTRVVHFLNVQVLKGDGRVLDGRDIERCHCG